MIHLTIFTGEVVRLNPLHIVGYHRNSGRTTATTVMLSVGEMAYDVMETPEEIDELLEDR